MASLIADDARRAPDLFASGQMVLVCAIWGTQQVAIKLSAPAMAPVLQVGLRSAVAALVVYCLVHIDRRAFPFRDGIWCPGIVVGGLFALEFLLFAHGLNYTSASRMSVFLYTAPVFAALGLHLLTHEERLSLVQWFGIAIAISGIAIAYYEPAGSRTGENGWVGDALGIGAGAAWGLTTVFIRSSRLATTPPSVTLWYQLTGVAVLATVVALVSGRTSIDPTPIVLASLVWQVFVISVASYLAWFMMLTRYFASRLGVLSLLTPLFGVMFGVAIMGDALAPTFLIGGGLILAGILIVQLPDALGSS